MCAGPLQKRQFPNKDNLSSFSFFLFQLRDAYSFAEMTIWMRKDKEAQLEDYYNSVLMGWILEWKSQMKCTK
jgi:hypothetical protein